MTSFRQIIFHLEVSSRVEKFYGSLLFDLAQVWQCPDRLVWNCWSGSDLALVSISWQKCLYVAKEIFFYKFLKITVLASSRPDLKVSARTGNQTVWSGAGQRNEIFPHGFRISHILFKKWNFLILIVFFEIQTKNIHFITNCVKQNL